MSQESLKKSSLPYALLSGLLIGACDLVPGVSGGTMALILGIYEQLMSAIASLKRISFKESKQLIFLITVILGIATSLLTLSSFFHQLLQDPSKKVYLYSLFFGLVLGSLWFVSKEVPKWNGKSFAFLSFGALLAFLLSQLPSVEFTSNSGILTTIYLMICGSLAIFAMLLPGISGSYMLMVLGPYPLVIESLSRFSSGLKNGFIDVSSFEILIPVGIGIILGAIFFSQLINDALKKYRAATLSILLGFMIGSTRAVWPFTVEAPSLLPFLTILTGVLLVIVLESIAVRRYRVKA